MQDTVVAAQGEQLSAKVLPGRPMGIEDNRSEEHTSEPQSQSNLVCRLLLEKKKYLARFARRHGFRIADDYSLIWRHHLISYELPSILIFFRSANCPIMLNCRTLKCSDHSWI